ncbi:elongation factor P maturation arginine rhamnosyltransferase EarP [Thiofaba sp. EF100]|uniref:elongation factor P maturation arginine rhamnosyltransferase EarP n=1 Tax=Thiofaba sp. EF100 TaxID=3121274 RepID=UPI00322145B6
MRANWDIFCTVIDNFGDIATCWRLARLLTHEHGQSVRLWVDDLATMQRLVPATRLELARQPIDGIEVCHWSRDFPSVQPAAVVIEAFGCTLPEGYVAAMRELRPLWINLEYFSAEDWVVGCHGLPSTQRDGQVKYFFFPGIQPGTGGLLRERGLLAARDAFLVDPTLRARWCESWGMPAPVEGGLVLSLFTYEHPALPVMLRELAEAPCPVTVYVPQGRTLNSVREAFPERTLAPGTSMIEGSLHLHVIPFLPQAEYDRLLWLCDLNFVRGEESLTRAIWSGRPFIWHVYPTEDMAHLDKLDAFVGVYAGHAQSGREPFAAMMRAWNEEALNPGEAAPSWWSSLEQLRERAPWFGARSRQLAQTDDLATQLVKFAAAHYNAKVLQPLSPSGTD